MANTSLTGHPNYSHFFHERVLVNTQYWLDYVTNQTTEVAALNDERDRIVKAISFALDLEPAWPFVYKLIVAFSSYMERSGHWESWNWLLNRAVDVARRVENTAEAITLSALLARLLQRQSQFKQAITHYRRAIRMARQTENYFEEARACSNLGYLYIEQGYWRRAEVLCCHALTIFESINSKHGRAHTENHLGFLYTRQYSWDKARQHLERACDIWQAMGDDHGLMRGLVNLGALYILMDRPNQALSCLEKAMQQARLTGEESEIGKIYTNMGLAHRLNGELAQAEAYAWRAETIFRRFSNSADLALVWINLGQVYIDQKMWPEARGQLEAALEACRNLKNEYGQIQALMGMVEYELARGNQEQATTQLRELDRLIQPHEWKAWDRQLQLLLIKYRRNLTGRVTKTSEVANVLRLSETSEV